MGRAAGYVRLRLCVSYGFPVRSRLTSEVAALVHKSSTREDISLVEAAARHFFENQVDAIGRASAAP